LAVCLTEFGGRGRALIILRHPWEPDSAKSIARMHLNHSDWEHLNILALAVSPAFNLSPFVTDFMERMRCLSSPLLYVPYIDHEQHHLSWPDLTEG
jgi:hypothetical protein